MARAGLEAGDEGLFLREHGLLPGELRLLLGREHGALALVEVVVAREGGELAAVDLDDLVHQAVHELPVVGGHHHRALEALEKALQPEDRLQVQVVGGLVEEQRVGALQQNLREGHAHLPSAREGADVAVHDLFGEAQAREDLPRARLQRVAVELLEARLRDAVALQDGLHVALVGRVAHGPLDLVQRVGGVGDLARARHGLFDHGAPAHLADVLGEVPEGDPAVDGDLAAVGLLVARDEPKDGGFARAVGPDEPDLFALEDPHGGFEEEDLRPVLLGDLVESNHARRVSRPARPRRRGGVRCRRGSGTRARR